LFVQNVFIVISSSISIIIISSHFKVLLVLSNLVMTRREKGRSQTHVLCASMSRALVYHAWARRSERQLRLIYASVIDLYLFGFMYHVSLLRCNLLHRNLSLPVVCNHVCTPSLENGTPFTARQHSLLCKTLYYYYYSFGRDVRPSTSVCPSVTCGHCVKITRATIMR